MRILAVIAIFLYLQPLSAQQVILLEADSTSQVIENADLSNDFLDFPLDLFFKNNTDDNISVNWRREFGDDCPSEWEVISADQMQTYTPIINESQIPLELTPSDSNFIVRQIFLPRNVSGCCDIKMIFSLEGDPQNPIDTGYYQIEINSNGCISTATVEDDLNRINIYPNPTQQILNISNTDLIESIQIVDLNGKSHMNSSSPLSKQIDISSLTSGVYICKIISKKGSVSIQKIIKE